jgi:hypothetical protein
VRRPPEDRCWKPTSLALFSMASDQDLPVIIDMITNDETVP